MTTLQVAQYYHSLGIQCIPWEHRKKGGGLLIPSWSEYTHTRITPEQIIEWFSRDCGIAIITGEISGITVVDDDLRGMAPRLVSNCMARSGGGGHHYYYKYSSLITTCRRADMNLEVKNNGALIYAYPTIHESGKQYEFVGGVESLANLQPFPITNHLICDMKARVVKDVKERDERIYTDGYAEYFSQGTGARDSKLKEFCLMLWKKNMSEGQVLSLARLANATYAPPLEDSVVVAKVASTFRGMGQKEDFTAGFARRDNEEPPPSPLISYTGAQAQEAYDLQIEQCGKGISTGYPSLDTHFRLFPKHLYMITAGTHQGKTTVALAIATKVAEQGKRVTFFSLEDGLFIVPKILKMSPRVPNTLTIVDSDSFPTPRQILTHIQEQPADMVVVDHIHFLSSDDKKESIKDTIIEIAKNLKLLSKKLNIPIISLVHIKKQDKAKDTPPLIDDMKDAQELGGLSNVVVILHRKRIPTEKIQPGDEYFDQVGTLNIAKSKVPGGRTGSIQFGIIDNQFTTTPYVAPLQIIDTI